MKIVHSKINFFLGVIFVIFMYSCHDSTTLNKNAIPELGSQDGKWFLVWSDEFNYEGLPDPGKWIYEVGHARGTESQYYTKARPENAFVKGGVLTITAIKEKYPNGDYKNPDIPPDSRRAWRTLNEFEEYTSASINTKYRAAWLYGKIDVRAKLPQGTGVWPAIWTLGTNIDSAPWPRSGEVDIMEFIGKLPEAVHSNVHWRNNNGEHKSQNASPKVDAPWNDFHVYSLEWNENEMIFYYDNEVIHRVDISVSEEAMSKVTNADTPLRADGMEAFHQPQFLLLNLALGGGWGGPVIDDNMLPQTFQVDYVRVYQLKK